MSELFPGTLEALNELSAYKKPVFEDVDDFTLECEHFDDLKKQLGFKTVWAFYSGIMELDQQIFSNKVRTVTYKCIDSLGDTFEDTTYKTFTATAKNGTVGALWAAAEACFLKAQAELDDWHIYIENFEVQEDGTLELITGS